MDHSFTRCLHWKPLHTYCSYYRIIRLNQCIATSTKSEYIFKYTVIVHSSFHFVTENVRMMLVCTILIWPRTSFFYLKLVSKYCIVEIIIECPRNAVSVSQVVCVNNVTAASSRLVAGGDRLFLTYHISCGSTLLTPI